MVESQLTMNIADLVRATILLKSPNPKFTEESLYHAFCRLAQDDDHYGRLFVQSCDGSSPDHTTLLETVLSFMEVGRLVEYTDGWQYLRLTKHGREAISRRLRERYGDTILVLG